jgi:hypothetical protein
MFPVLLFAVSVLIAGTAAYFSVRGIGLLFAGSFLPVVVMASSLEIGKLFAVSFLYRQWHVMRRVLRFYLSVAVLLLIAITSLGIFGFLSDAYQHTRNQVNLYESKIESVESNNNMLRKKIELAEQNTIKTTDQSNTNTDRYKQIYDDFVTQQNQTKQQIQSRLDEMNNQLSELERSPGGLFSSKTKKLEQLKTDQQPEREQITQQLTQIDLLIKQEYDRFMSKVDQQTTKQTDTVDIDSLYKQIDTNNEKILEYKTNIKQTDVGSFKFIAESFGLEVDDAVKWFIIMIVVVFDPLAMCLIIGYNMYVTSGTTIRQLPPAVIPTKFNKGKTIIKPIHK